MRQVINSSTNFQVNTSKISQRTHIKNMARKHAVNGEPSFTTKRFSKDVQHVNGLRTELFVSIASILMTGIKENANDDRSQLIPTCMTLDIDFLVSSLTTLLHNR
jgi:hypothetical protein